MSLAPPEVARGRRNTELALLVLVIILAVGAYALVGLGRDRQVPVGIFGYGLLLGSGYLGAHLAVRRFAPDADPIFLPSAGLLAGLGFAVIYR
ncbi:MAG TPA: FtsW/RodA/SpoVE family cell cycle protein, partial [Actinomycetota bacterium]|nr:FtsW/RodA/SpoVE family cell cycle protein [Actinomycetota bacterium]